MNVFLLAHQDDEFACFAILEKLILSKGAVKVVYLTSGAQQGGNPERRNRESLRVLGHLGVSEDSVLFFGEDMQIPDGQLHRHLSTAYEPMRALFDGHDVAGFYMPAWEGGHQDHDAAHLLGIALSESFSCVNDSFQFSLYNGRGLPGILFRVLSPLERNGVVFSKRLSWSQRLRYLSYCTSYRSQISTWVGLLPFVVVKYLFCGSQQWQPISRARVDQRPHEGALLYERRQFCTTEEFEQRRRRFLKSMASFTSG